MMEKLAPAADLPVVRVGGARPSPITIYLPSRTKLWCTLKLRGQIYSPLFLLYPYMLSVGRKIILNNELYHLSKTTRWVQLLKCRKDNENDLLTART
jgi:hypothetical protein